MGHTGNAGSAPPPNPLLIWQSDRVSEPCAIAAVGSRALKENAPQVPHGPQPFVRLRLLVGGMCYALQKIEKPLRFPMVQRFLGLFNFGGTEFQWERYIRVDLLGPMRTGGVGSEGCQWAQFGSQAAGSNQQTASQELRRASSTVSSGKPTGTVGQGSLSLFCLKGTILLPFRSTE